ncbi:MAG TPA: DNA polymerase/3'-5' exonuclease PolX [Aggregatilineales bacterium]|nr:DNA polymerase/3'-5' exonuclease PolX [Aggregatilineales bacterium]
MSTVSSDAPDKALTNQQVADIFDTIADMLQLKGEIIHRVMAYRRAAESIRELPRDLRAVAAEGKLQEIDGIGKTLEEKIQEMLDTGHLKFYDELQQEVPPSLVEILRINGVGPKKAMLFYKELGIKTVDELKAAAEGDKLAGLPGVGPKSAKKILEGIASLAATTERVRIDLALVAAERLLRNLLTAPGALQGHVGGSIRRGRATIGDIDLLVASQDAEPIMQAFITDEQVGRVAAHGPTKSSVELVNGRLCDLRVLPPERYGTALVYFTGGQAHNIHLRALAQERDLTLNEWAFTRPDGSEILCATEEEVYRTLDLQYIPPEMREDRGEIEAAAAGKIPRLIEIGDIRSDLHMHTNWSDGKLSVREMAEAARSHGLLHIVITDHSQSLGVANGLTVERLRAQRQEIRQVDSEMGPGFRVFQGVELEIRTDGQLDYPDEILAELDVVVASLHSGLRQDRAQVTERLLTAIRNPNVDIIGHPRGQLIPDRPGADLDMDAVFAAAKETGTVLEINANPHRLDLDDAHARRAVEMGVMLSIDTDSHAPGEFDVLRYGIMTARRAWVRPENVINTWPTEHFIRWMQSK